MRYRLSYLLFLLTFVSFPLEGEARVESSDPVKVSLYAEADAISPGGTTYLGLNFKIDPQWHIYWKNPGDSGLPVNVTWKLPEGVEAGPLEWPTPHRISLAGLVTYGFEDEVTLLVPLSISENMKVGQSILIEARVFWLMCKEVCLPGNADISIELPIASSSGESSDFQVFEEARTQFPEVNDQWLLSTNSVGGTLEVRIEGETSMAKDWYFFAESQDVFDPNAEQKATYDEYGSILLQLPFLSGMESPKETFRGILTNDIGSWKVNLNEEGGTPIDQVDFGEARSFEHSLLNLGLPGWLVLAFVGGLILNVMPCVLPVLSLKVFSLVKHSGESRRQVFTHALAYTIGVVGSFLLLAGAVFALKALGEGIGWGFQLQSPGFVVVLAMLLFMFGLNMLGVFEIGMGLVGADAKVLARKGLAGSFGMGVLAAVVGAPCMGPMIASVSGVAIQASISTGLLLFGVMGLGLASPFLFLAAFPKLVACLPKPGAWMEVFKQSMGFLLILSVVFLVYVLGQQTGVNGIVNLLLVLVVSSMAGWIYGRWGAPVKSPKTRRIAIVTAFALLFGSGFYGVRSAVLNRGCLVAESMSNQRKTTWTSWSEARVQEELAKGNSVFVDFTASWCLICQANKIATRSATTTELFQANKIVSLEADWTRRDPRITKALERFDRAGVPLYLLYTPDGEVMILPQSLNNGVIRQAVEKVLK